MNVSRFMNLAAIFSLDLESQYIYIWFILIFLHSNRQIIQLKHSL